MRAVIEREGAHFQSLKASIFDCNYICKEDIRVFGIQNPKPCLEKQTGIVHPN